MLGSGGVSALAVSVLGVGVVGAGPTAPGRVREGCRERHVVMEGIGEVRISVGVDVGRVEREEGREKLF